jgi:hypothetical protein
MTTTSQRPTPPGDPPQPGPPLGDPPQPPVPGPGQPRIDWRSGPMSALGHKRTFAVQKDMFALPPKADIGSAMASNGMTFVLPRPAPSADQDQNG